MKKWFWALWAGRTILAVGAHERREVAEDECEAALSDWAQEMPAGFLEGLVWRKDQDDED